MRTLLFFFTFLYGNLALLAQQQAFSNSAEAKLDSKGEMTILAWYSIQPEGLTSQRFNELREAGFTHSFSESFVNNDKMEEALDLAEQAGLKLIVATPELAKEPEKTVRRFMKHPATAGYFLRDEPSTADFENLGKWAKRIQAVDMERYCYLNLFPDYAPLDVLKASSYWDYVDRFDKEVNLPLLSFDYYPIVVDGNGKTVVRESFFNTLETFLKKSQQVNKPFWAFALATAHDPYPIPNMNHLRFQMYSNLAYGAQALQYFTFWTPKKNPNWNFHHGPIDEDNKRTEVYDYITILNREIQGLSPVFLGAKVLSVQHTGDKIPANTKALKTLPMQVKFLKTSGSAGAIVTHLENGNREFLIIVNRDIHMKMNLAIDLEDSVQRVMKDGTLISANAYSQKMGVEPGDILVYSWTK